MTASVKVVDGIDAKYLVKSDKSGYTITNLSDKSVTRLNFDKEDNSWSVNANGKDTKFMQFVDDSHVKMITPEGGFTTVELSQEGVYAYEQKTSQDFYALK